MALALAAPGFAAPPSEPFEVREIEIVGLRSNARVTVERELGFGVGDRVGDAELVEARRRLRNLSLFHPVEVERADGDRVRITVSERWTVIPIFNAQTGGGSRLFQLGIFDLSALGRGAMLGGFYENFNGESGGDAWWVHPRFAGGTDAWWKVSADVSYRRRNQGRYDNSAGAAPRRLADDLVARNGRVGAGASRDLNRWWNLGFSLGLLSQRPEGGASVAVATRETLVEPAVTLTGDWLNREDHLFEGLRGSVAWSPRWDLSATAGQGANAPPPHLVRAELRWFERIGENRRLNYGARLAGRAAIGRSTLAQDDLTAGGFSEVRGFHDAQYRTRALGLLNQELRYTLVERVWWTLQVAGFLDLGWIPATTLGGAGGGIRLASPKIATLGIRLDYAVPVFGNGAAGVAFGIMQFF